MEENKKKKDHSDVEVGLIIASVAVLAVFIIFMVLNPTSTLNGISSFFNMMISGLGPAFEVVSVVVFVCALVLGFGKYGNLRLGNCKPQYSNFSYFAMMLLASLASAALYWSFTEWAYYYQSPGIGIVPESLEAMESSLGYQFFHWGIVNQSMYTIMGVAIAYGVYVRKLPSFQTSAVCCAMMGEKIKPKTKTALGKVIDFLVMFGILGALSSSLGLAVPLSAGGLKVLFGWEATPVVQIGIIVFIAIVYSFTAYLGTEKGMQVISNIASLHADHGTDNLHTEDHCQLRGTHDREAAENGTLYRSCITEWFPGGMDGILYRVLPELCGNDGYLYCKGFQGKNHPRSGNLHNLHYDCRRHDHLWYRWKLCNV